MEPLVPFPMAEVSHARSVTDDVLQRIEIWKLQNEYGYRVQY